MSVLVKIIHAAKAEGRNLKVEICRRLLNYQNTPHPSTGVAPSELMLVRQIRNRVPRVLGQLMSNELEQAREKDHSTRLIRKEKFDKKKNVTDKVIKQGDTVLLKQDKSTVKSPYDARPYQVTEIKGTRAMVVRDNKEKKRSFNKIKLVKKRLLHLEDKVS